MKIKLDNISKRFLINKKRNQYNYVLRDISYEFESGKTYFILGPSGSGKSTLLSILGLLDSPSDGEILFDGNPVENKQEFISQHVSFCFQDYNLFENLTVYDNLLIYESDKDKLDSLLKYFNCSFSLNMKIKYLSGGEKQRLSILRSYLKGGDILLLDEPTGNLDFENSKKVMELVQKISNNKIVIVVSHNHQLAYHFGDEVILLNDGTISEIKENRHTLILDFQNNGKSEIGKLYDILFNYGEFECEINGDIFAINRNNYIELCDNIYSKNQRKQTQIRLITTSEVKKTLEEADGVQFNKKQFLNKFSYKNLLGRIGRTIATFVSLLLTTVSIFVCSNLTFFDTDYQSAKILESKTGFAYQLTMRTDSGVYYRGAALNGPVNKNENCYGSLITSIWHPINQRNYPIQIYITKLDTVTIEGKRYEIPDDSVLLSDYIDGYGIELNELPIISLNLPLLVSKERIQIEAKYKWEDNPDVNTESFGFVSYDYLLSEYVNALPENTKMNLNCPQTFFGFLRPNVSQYLGQDIIKGNQIQNKQEIIVSQTIYNNLLSKMDDPLGKTFSVGTLQEEGASNFGDYINDLHDVYSEYTLVGVTDDEYSFVYIHKDAYKSFLSQYLVNNGLPFIGRTKIHETITYLHDNNIDLIDSPVAYFYELCVLEFNGFIIALLAVLVIISASVLLVWITNVLKDRFHEFAIMKCLGFKNIDIQKSFIKMASIISLAASLIGVSTGGILSVVSFSLFISGEASFNIMTFFASPLSFIIPIMFTILFTAIFTFIYSRKINSIEAYDALKEYK